MNTWIGGYPKSGTTWVKFIVVALLYRTNNAKKVEKYIPNIEKPSTVKKDGYYKTHVVRPPSGQLLYVVRHPVDICVSGANFYALSAGKVNYAKYVDEFIVKRGNTVRNFGTDLMMNVGGAIQGHPMGATSGAKAMRQAFEVERSRQHVFDVMDKNVELKEAIKKWGYKE